jgi:hypothetical protein
MKFVYSSNSGGGGGSSSSSKNASELMKCDM